ncbi:MAG TPA: hypothetical protein VK929_07770 [Longimicrobiales bacterium]|nr:hypothetical protein [Longimicrobiales bacterium]
MLGGNRSGRRGWAGALLVAAHLLAGVLLPLAHGAEERAAPEHAEAPGSHQQGHDPAACLVCRAADNRFLAGPASALIASPAEAVEHAGAPYRDLLPTGERVAWIWIRGPPTS